MTEPVVIEGEVVEDPMREVLAQRLAQAGPWEVVGTPESMCRCGHTIEREHLPYGCAVDGCGCRELRPWAELRTEQRTVLVPWEIS